MAACCPGRAALVAERCVRPARSPRRVMREVMAAAEKASSPEYAPHRKPSDESSPVDLRACQDESTPSREHCHADAVPRPSEDGTPSGQRAIVHQVAGAALLRFSQQATQLPFCRHRRGRTRLEMRSRSLAVLLRPTRHARAPRRLRGPAGLRLDERPATRAGGTPRPLTRLELEARSGVVPEQRCQPDDRLGVTHQVCHRT